MSTLQFHWCPGRKPKALPELPVQHSCTVGFSSIDPQMYTPGPFTWCRWHWWCSTSSMFWELLSQTNLRFAVFFTQLTFPKWCVNLWSCLALLVLFLAVGHGPPRLPKALLQPACCPTESLVLPQGRAWGSRGGEQAAGRLARSEMGLPAELEWLLLYGTAPVLFSTYFPFLTEWHLVCPDSLARQRIAGSELFLVIMVSSASMSAQVDASILLPAGTTARPRPWQLWSPVPRAAPLCAAPPSPPGWSPPSPCCPYANPTVSTGQLQSLLAVLHRPILDSVSIFVSLWLVGGLFGFEQSIQRCELCLLGADLICTHHSQWSGEINAFLCYKEVSQIFSFISGQVENSVASQQKSSKNFRQQKLAFSNQFTISRFFKLINKEKTKVW